jgi:hypothetical protein
MTFCDNQSCTTLSNDPKFNEKSKQVEICYHCLREKVESRLLYLCIVL